MGVRTLVKNGLEVVVESGAGDSSAAADSEYIEAGETIAGNASDAASGAQIVLGVNAPALTGIAEGTILVSFMNPLGDADLVRGMASGKITGISMEMVPRITRAQSMDALSSQATVAGYKAVLMASDHLPKFLPMFTTAAGTIRPGRALILGAGVAGLQAIATARRLGAMRRSIRRPAGCEGASGEPWRQVPRV